LENNLDDSEIDTLVSRRDLQPNVRL